MADRYTYVPYFGLFLMLVWGGAEIAERFDAGRNFGFLMIVAVVVLTILGFRQASLWRDQETLYRHTLAVTSGNSLIAHNLCHHLLTTDRLSEAEQYCREAIAARPDYALAYNSLGIIGMQQRKYAFASENFTKAVSIAPESVLFQVNLASALALDGRPEEAERVLQRASEVAGNVPAPDLFFDGVRLIAAAYAERKDFSKALENLKRAVFLAPNRPDARAELAMVMAELKDFAESNRQIEAALAAAPNDPRILTIYGRILMMQNRNTEAIGLFEQALKMQPNHEEARTYLKQAREKQ
jgi:tetratricopeptide (TPR) repeat protein